MNTFCPCIALTRCFLFLKSVLSFVFLSFYLVLLFCFLFVFCVNFVNPVTITSKRQKKKSEKKLTTTYKHCLFLKLPVRWLLIYGQTDPLIEMRERIREKVDRWTIITWSEMTLPIDLLIPFKAKRDRGRIMVCLIADRLTQSRFAIEENSGKRGWVRLSDWSIQ